MNLSKFQNIDAELARNKMTKLTLAKATGIRYNTLCDKLNGKTEFGFSEAIRIRDAICPSMSLETLFTSSV